MKGFRLRNIWLLGFKELLSLKSDRVMLVLMVLAFTVFVILPAKNSLMETRNASVAIVDQDRTPLSARIADALLSPYFKPPVMIDDSTVDDVLDRGIYTFVLRIPPRFQADLVAGRQPELQLLVDATAMSQAGNGAGYIDQIVRTTIKRWLGVSDAAVPVTPVIRIAYNPNLYGGWFFSINQLINMVAMLAIVLTGAALIRERERGTVEHLLVMPVSPLDIGVAKVWANSFAILVTMFLSVIFVVQGVLAVPIRGSLLLFLAGTFCYLFAISALGVLLGTVARSMPQLGLLFLPVSVFVALLSGGITPLSAMPVWIRYTMQLVPSTPFTSFAAAVLFRGAGIDLVWRDLAHMALIGAVFLAIALARFRASMAGTH